mgnify:CR=1 FL=1
MTVHPIAVNGKHVGTLTRHEYANAVYELLNGIDKGIDNRVRLTKEVYLLIKKKTGLNGNFTDSLLEHLIEKECIGNTTNIIGNRYYLTDHGKKHMEHMIHYLERNDNRRN